MTSPTILAKSKQTEIGDPFRAPPGGQRLYYTLLHIASSLSIPLLFNSSFEKSIWMSPGLENGKMFFLQIFNLRVPNSRKAHEKFNATI